MMMHIYNKNFARFLRYEQAANIKKKYQAAHKNVSFEMCRWDFAPFHIYLDNFYTRKR